MIAVKPSDRPGMGNTYYNLANLYQYTKRLKKAIETYKLCISTRKAEYGSKHPRVKKAELAMATALEQNGQAGEAASIRSRYGM